MSLGIASTHRPVPYALPSPSRYRVWSPPGGRMRIEYSNSLLREVRAQADDPDAWGILFGRRHGGAVHLRAVRSAALSDESDDPPGLDPVGIFAARPRGEVFLTESDLERFDRFERFQARASVALVVAGAKAGFFVHEPDGSLQSIRSHREFAIAGVPARPRRPVWPLALACAALWIAFATLRIHPPAPQLAVRENAGQLRIQWNPAFHGGTLEIRDGSARSVIPVTGTLSSATYQRRSSDVEIRLGTEAARVIGVPQSPRADPAPERLAQMKGTVRELKAAAAANRSRIATLQKILSKMDLDP